MRLRIGNAMGTATDMGRGYFPTMLAVRLGGGGLLAIVQGVRAASYTPIGPLPLPYQEGSQ